MNRSKYSKSWGLTVVGRNSDILKHLFVRAFGMTYVIEFATPSYLLLLYHCCQIFEFLWIGFPKILEICDFCFVLPSLLRFFLRSRPTFHSGYPVIVISSFACPA
jgi:hypothetical protein